MARLRAYFSRFGREVAVSIKSVTYRRLYTASCTCIGYFQGAGPWEDARHMSSQDKTSQLLDHLGSGSALLNVSELCG
jgi:hypothetical protein